MQRTILILFFIFTFCILYAQHTVVGTADLIIGEVSIIRGHLAIKPKRNHEILYSDVLKTGPGARIMIKLVDGNKINLTGGREQKVSDIISSAFSRRSSNALDRFMNLVSRLAKDDDSNTVMFATMGVRGVPDESAILDSLSQIEKILLTTSDPGDQLDLLLIRVDLYLELGDHRRAREACLEILSRDKKKQYTETIRGLLELIDAAGSRNIAIPLFEGPDPATRAAITETITTDLAKSGLLKIVERGDLESIITEQKLSVSDLADQGKAVRLGSLAGAHLILTGTYSILGDDMIINTRLVDVENGQIVKAWNINGTQEEILFFSQQLAGRIHYHLTQKKIPEQDMTGTLEAESDLKSLEGIKVLLGVNKESIPPVYKRDEELKIYFRVQGSGNKQYYITIMSIGPDGEVNLLFPNDFNTSNQIQLNQEYVLPADKDEYTIVTYGNPGTNNIIGIVTEKPLSLADSEKLRTEVFPVLSNMPGEYLSRGLAVKASKAKIDKWKIGKTEILLVED